MYWWNKLSLVKNLNFNLKSVLFVSPIFFIFLRLPSLYTRTLSQQKKNFHLMATLITGWDPDVNWCQSLSAGDFNAQIARSPLTKTRSRGAEAGHTCCTCTPITGPGGQCIEETWEGEVILFIRAFVTHRDKVNFKTLMRIRIKVKDCFTQDQKCW